MSRMLDALKVLEMRQRPPLEEPAKIDTVAAVEAAWEATVESLLPALCDEEEQCSPPDPLVGISFAAPEPPKPSAPFETCTLPTSDALATCYLEAAERIGEQLTSNYCNVLLFVTPDRRAEPCFSMTHLAQAFAQRGPGDVLLVDGDLRDGQLSHHVSRPGPGMTEAMLGHVNWPDIIHPTNTGHVDFVARGNGQVPTVERTEFGWGALRPLYRSVLIGLATASEPETNWLAARCDAVYLVISRPHTRRGSASTAVNLLRASGANVVGCIVVND